MVSANREMAVYCFDTLVSHYNNEETPPPAFEEANQHSIVSRIYVEGYDTSLSGHDFVMSMRAHFVSCGEVMLVYIPGYVRGRSIGNRFAFVYLRGEGAEERALKLHGSYMGGHKLVVEPYPFHATYLDHKLAKMRQADNKQQQYK